MKVILGFLFGAGLVFSSQVFANCDQRTVVRNILEHRLAPQVSGYGEILNYTTQGLLDQDREMQIPVGATRRVHVLNRSYSDTLVVSFVVDSGPPFGPILWVAQIMPDSCGVYDLQKAILDDGANSLF